MASYHGTLLCLDNRLIDPSNPNDTVLAQIDTTLHNTKTKNALSI